MKCPRCKYENEPSARTCANCGAALRPRPAAVDNTQVFTRSQLAGAQEGRPARSPYARPTAAQDGDYQSTNVYAAAPRTVRPEPEYDGPLYEDELRTPPHRTTRRTDDYARRFPEAYEPDEYEPDDIEDDEVEEAYEPSQPVAKRRNTMLIAGICVLVLMTILMLVICFITFTSAGQRWKASMGMNAPASAYWQLGDESFTAGDIATAAQHYESALSRDSTNYLGAVKLAEALKHTGNTERAERAYRLAMSLKPTETLPYDNVLALMSARSATTDEVIALLRTAYQNTASETYNTQLQAFGPGAVRFDPDGGEYSYAVKLQMAGDTDSTIYYTTDGSQPTTDSAKYVLPIELGEGAFTVRAIAVRNGMYSGETLKTYSIDFPTVDAPQFTSKPGKYSVTSDGVKVISVVVPEGCTVYYSTDGSAPTRESKKYDEGIMLKPGTHTLRMIAINGDGAVSAETSAEYVILGELEEPFTDADRFKSFFVDVTTQDDVNKQFKKLLETTGDPSTFFTQRYRFGEVDFTVRDGVPLVTAIRIVNNDITGVRGTKVGWDADDVIKLFRDEQNDIVNGERELYTLDHDRYGWVEYDGDEISRISYMYTRDDVQLVELHFIIEDGEVSEMEYCISDM